jgi:hypothetical protein
MYNCEEEIELALIIIKNGHSVRKVANDYGISWTRLWNRLRRDSVQNSSHHHQPLSPKQENI